MFRNEKTSIEDGGENGAYLDPTMTTQTDRRGSAVAVDAVFGEITEDGPNYRAVGWKGAVVLMLKTQVGLGVLSIPAVFDTLGLAPGIICLIAIAICTSWSGYIVGTFKLRHSDVYGLDDIGRKLFGRAGYEVFGIAFALFCIFVAGSGILGITTALNALSSHGACTAIFVAVAAIIGFLLSSIQTLGRISWLAWAGTISILVSILILTIAVGVQDRPSAAPQTGTFVSDWKAVNHPDATSAFAALSSIVFAYAGVPAYFNIVSEMREPRHFTKSLVWCQSIMTATYITIGVVVYYYCGSYVASPALGSAGPLLKKICYGIAILGLIVSTTMYIHFAAKYFFIRFLRGTSHLARNTTIHWITWIGCTGSCAGIAYIIASAVPVFGGLVSLIGALLGTLMCFQPMGSMWLYDHWTEGNKQKTIKWMAMVFWSFFIIISGTFLMVAGTYGSVVGIIDSYKATGGSSAWTCADNSNSS